MGVELILTPEQIDDPAAWATAAARALGLDPAEITAVRLDKRSIDARQRAVVFRVQAEVGTRSAPLEPAGEPPRPEYPPLAESAQPVIVVGAGPAGLFAALSLIRRGLKPVLLERGKDARARAFDLAPINREGRVNPESNYCFGEGGAGTFSDGKLYTRATKRGPVRTVYEVLVAHGADPDILVDAHPHVGSNRLPKLVRALRESILAAGGEVHFETRVTGLLRDGSGRLVGVSDAAGREWRGIAVILATGHSARDIYGLLAAEGIALEPKPFAVGVRIEHPQGLIDASEYHLKPGQSRHPKLPAARYRVAHEAGRDKRPVHSFCMCPGGFVVPASTADEWVVVNGMSHARRDNEFANSGLVAQVFPADYAELTHEHGVLAGIEFQARIERAAKLAGGNRPGPGGRGQVAPAQRAADFVARRDSIELPPTSYHPGLHPARLDLLLPGFVAKAMAEGLRRFERRIPGYLGPGALMIGFETRTSSPLRIPRDPTTLQHPQVPGLYPCAEGAGYAGGIVSAAMDGMRCAEAVDPSR